MNELTPEVHFDGKVAQKAIIEHNGKVLVMHDHREDSQVWEIPGGRMNVGEDPKTSLAREIKEELGVDCDIHEVLHMTQFHQLCDDRNAFMIAYRVTLKDLAQPFVLDDVEVAKIKWIAAEDLEHITLFPEYEDTLKIYFKNKPQ